MSDYTVNDILNNRPCPSITPMVILVGEKLVPIIIIKEYEESLLEIKENQLVGVKSSTLGNNNISLFLIMLKFGESFDYTYDIWFNYGYDLHREFLNLLEKDKIIMDFRNDKNERYLSLELKNTISENIKYYKDLSEAHTIFKKEKIDNVIEVSNEKKYKLWKEDDAFNLMDKIFSDYETIEELWECL